MAWGPFCITKAYRYFNEKTPKFIMICSLTVRTIFITNTNTKYKSMYIWPKAQLKCACVEMHSQGSVCCCNPRPHYWNLSYGKLATHSGKKWNEKGTWSRFFSSKGCVTFIFSINIVAHAKQWTIPGNSLKTKNSWWQMCNFMLLKGQVFFANNTTKLIKFSRCEFLKRSSEEIFENKVFSHN